MYFVYLTNHETKEHISIGIFSTYELAETAAHKASEYWNADLDRLYYLSTTVLLEVDKLPNYLT